MSPIEPSRIQNRLLQALPPAVLDALLPSLQRVECPFRTVLHGPDMPVTGVHFIETGYVSMLATLEDGDAAEVGMIGPEGMVGLQLFFGTERSPLEALVQAEGTALTLDAESFRRAVDQHRPLLDLLLRYAMAFQMQITMTAACNARHVVEQRLARWLLMAHDRVTHDEFAMTHEFLSMMLGVRRSGISVAAATLQRAGLIRYEVGRIQVIDRAGLEAAACECHGVSRREFLRLLG